MFGHSLTVSSVCQATEKGEVPNSNPFDKVTGDPSVPVPHRVAIH
jgi:hypothetical protein